MTKTFDLEKRATLSFMRRAPGPAFLLLLLPGSIDTERYREQKSFTSCFNKNQGGRKSQWCFFSLKTSHLHRRRRHFHHFHLLHQRPPRLPRRP